MAKITDPDDLAQGTEIVISTASYTIQLLEAGDLVAADGVTLQCVYSFLKEEWKDDAGLIPHPFPIIAITEESMEIHDTWDWADSTTKTYIRDGGWALKSGSTSNEEYMNVTTLGSFAAGADTAYYQQSSSATPTESAVFSGPMNEVVRIYASPSAYPSDTFDYRDYFFIYLREQGKTYDSYNLLTEQNLSTLTYKKYAMPLSNTTDVKITHDDGYISTGSDYTGITIAYYTESQARTIGSSDYHFDVIIDGDSKTAEQIYEKIQYQLRQWTDIDTRSDYPTGITGSVADELLSFIGDTLRTSQGVYIDNFAVADTNRLEFTDTGSTVQTFPYVAAGEISVNNYLSTDATSRYWMFFTSVPSGSFGSATAVIVNDNNDLPITGAIADDTSSYGIIDFSFDYDNNIQGGRTAQTSAAITVVAIGLATAQYVRTTSTITRSTANAVSLVAALERNYANP